MWKSRVLKPTVLFIAVAGGACAGLIALGVTLDGRTAHADGKDPPTQLTLPAGKKLVDMSWRCFGDYPCAPFTLTRAMRKDEAPETYTFSSPDPDVSLTYVIKESR